MTSVRKGQRSQQAVQEPTDEASTKHNQLSGSFSKMYIANPYPGIHNRNFLDWAPYSQILKYLFSEFFIEPFLKTSASAVRFQNIDKCNKYSSFALSVPPPNFKWPGIPGHSERMCSRVPPRPAVPSAKCNLTQEGNFPLFSSEQTHFYHLHNGALCRNTCRAHRNGFISKPLLPKHRAKFL